MSKRDYASTLTSHADKRTLAQPLQFFGLAFGVIVLVVFLLELFVPVPLDVGFGFWPRLQGVFGVISTRT